MTEDNELLMVLLRLKSYLISLIDSPNDCNEGLSLSEEYLDRKFPNYKEEILDFLEMNEIKSDCDIVFNQNILEKFQDISTNQEGRADLQTMLEKLHIESRYLIEENKRFEESKKEREEVVKQIVALLMKIANEWLSRKGIEESIDDFSTLEEEDLLRPDEVDFLDSLSTKTGISYSKLSTLTLIYLKLFVDYLFENGGNISLKNFLDKLKVISDSVEKKYKKLFEQSGLKTEPE